MSKIIETLQKQMSSHAESSKETVAQTERERVKKARTMTQKQLADIYFRSGSGETQQLPAPTVIHVKEKKSIQFFPWFISLLALFISVFTLMTSKKFEIDIRVIDPGKAVSSEQIESKPFNNTSAGSAISEVKTRDSAGAFSASEETQPIQSESVKLPESLEILPMQFRFAGASVLNSTKDRAQLTLTNSSLASLAYAWIEYDPPLDLTSYRLFFEIRGSAGGEQVELIFKDKNGNSSLNWKSIRPFESGLSSEWQPYVLDLEATPYFDGHRIQQMRIEVGSQRTGNEPGAKIMIRNLQLWPQNKELSELPSVNTGVWVEESIT